MEARMLPAHAELSRDLVSEIVDHFKKYIDKHDITAAQSVAKFNTRRGDLRVDEESYKGDVSAVTAPSTTGWSGTRAKGSPPPERLRVDVAGRGLRTYVYLATSRRRC